MDDRCAGSFRADAGGVLEFLFEQRILDQFGDVLHRLDQIAFGVGFWRLRPKVLEIHLRHSAFDALAQSRQGLRCWCFAAPGRCQCFGQCALPARFDDLLAHRAQRLPVAIEIGLGAIIFVIGQELRQVARANQRVHRAMLAGQTFKILRGDGGNDAVVSADLGVIPGSRAPLRFEKTLQHFKARIGLTQCGEDRWRLTVLAQRQKAAITARIGDDFVGFVKGLCDVEGLLRAKAKLFRADFLQGAEIKGQGRDFAHALGFQLDHPCAVCTADRRRCLLR